jgi:hypothetical protein
MPTENILAAIKAIVFSKYDETTSLLNKKDKRLTLTETHPDAKCRQVIFTMIDDIVVYKFDKVVRDEHNEIQHPLLFLEKETPIRSTCDYILFYLKTTKKGVNKLYVIICNMKSAGKSNMEEQMLAGVILGEFIAKTAFRCHNNWNSETSNKLREDFIVQEIAFYSKLPSSIKNPKGVSKPQKAVTQRKNLECGKEYQLDFYINS